MKLKASLHIHTKEDERDGHMIDYSIYQLIDEAKKHGFHVLGFTPHQKFVFKQKYADYAREKGIILLPGVERNMGRILNKHVIILNCDKSIEQVKNFKQLVEYKKNNPDIFILSAHPTFSRIISIGAKNLKKYIDLFDAIEHSWLYSVFINSNRKAGKIARKSEKPMIATADVHNIKKLNTDHAIINADEFSSKAVLEAISRGDFENVTIPKKLISIYGYLFMFNLKYAYRYFVRRILCMENKKLVPVEIDENEGFSE